MAPSLQLGPRYSYPDPVDTVKAGQLCERGLSILGKG